MNAKNKIYFKVYQDIDSIDGESYIVTPEEFMIKSINEYASEEKLPVIEIVMMTEEEVNSLPEFQGY